MSTQNHFFKIYYLSFRNPQFLNDGNNKNYKRSGIIKKKGKKFKILIIDNEQMILEMYKIKLQKTGYNVYTAYNAEQGLKLAKQKSPDLILANVLMPGHDRFYLLREIKDDPSLRDIPVIGLSELNDKDQEQRAYKFGALGFLVKFGLLPKDVANVIGNVLDKK